MDEHALIPVFTGTIQNQSIQLCNARDLHAYLQIGKDFSNWIKDRIQQYDFNDGIDYLVFSPKLAKTSKGGRPSKDYHLTLDMAKELAMVENNEQGKAARRYFIELERKINQLQNETVLLPSAQSASTPSVKNNHLIPVITVSGEHITTSSHEIARIFKKQHSDIVDYIKSLNCSEGFKERNFTLVKFTDKHDLKHDSYEITKDGFVFLAMSFTGLRATQHKENFIAEFNAKEQAVFERVLDRALNLAPTPLLPNRQEKMAPSLKRKIIQKAHDLSLAQYDTIHEFITAMVEKSIDSGANEHACIAYIEQYGSSMGGVVVVNQYELYKLVRSISNLLNDAGDVLALIHKLEERTGLELYTRKDGLSMTQSLVEDVLSKIKGKGYE